MISERRHSGSSAEISKEELVTAELASLQWDDGQQDEARELCQKLKKPFPIKPLSRLDGAQFIAALKARYRNLHPTQRTYI
jgi:hypothetical protein